MRNILDTAHHYLQLYCVVEVSVIIFFTVLTGKEIQWYFDNLERIKEWDSAVLAAFNASSVGIIKYCLDSINVEYKAGNDGA